MKKKIAVFGTSYVGLVTAVGLAEIGHDVTAVDIDTSRIKELKKGYLPFYEPGLKGMLKKNLTVGKIRFTTEGDEAVTGNNIIFIAVGTPSKADGRVDLSQVDKVFDVIAENLDTAKTIIIKSTIPPGTVNSFRELYSSELQTTSSEIIFCPEFLREGTAVHDFFHPDRIIVGADSVEASRTVNSIFFPIISRLDVPVLRCRPVSAEMIKYGSNVMLASRIAVMNELAEMSEAAGSDIREISAGVGMDKRIGKEFLKAGPGFGGSCFGKDVAGIVRTAEYYGLDLRLISGIIKSNDRQRVRPALRLEKALGSLKGKKIAVLGLAFKADTDDVRGSAAFDIINYLVDKGAQVKAHDPRAEYNFIRLFRKKGYTCTDKAEDALKGAWACIILTEWKEYNDLSPGIFSCLMRGKIIIDARNILDGDAFRYEGFRVFGSGRPETWPAARTITRSDFVNAAIVSV